MAASIVVRNDDDGFDADFGPLQYSLESGGFTSIHPLRIVQWDRFKTTTFTPEALAEATPRFLEPANGVFTLHNDDAPPRTQTTTTTNSEQATWVVVTFRDQRSATIVIHPRIPQTDASDDALRRTVTVASTTLTTTITATATESSTSSAAKASTGLIAATSIVGALFALACISVLFLWRRVRALECQCERANTHLQIAPIPVVNPPAAKEVYASETPDPMRSRVFERAELSAENSERMSNLA